MTSTVDIRTALDEFESLLEDRDSKEGAWQDLFSRYPFILADGLALDIEPEAIVPCKPGEAEADFYFYPADGSRAAPYGVIEIKRPSMRLLKVPRKDVICLSADGTAAVAQATKYAEEVDARVQRTECGLVILGNRLHTFVVAGLSDEIARKVTTQILRDRAAKLLPRGCSLMPFDTLAQQLRTRRPPVLHLLMPGIPRALTDIESSKRDDGFRPRGDFFGGSPKMYPAACTECRHWTFVPFRPRTGRIVFCRDCYMRQREQREWSERAPR